MPRGRPRRDPVSRIRPDRRPVDEPVARRADFLCIDVRRLLARFRSRQSGRGSDGRGNRIPGRERHESLAGRIGEPSPRSTRRRRDRGRRRRCRLPPEYPRPLPGDRRSGKHRLHGAGGVRHGRLYAEAGRTGRRLLRSAHSRVRLYRSGDRRHPGVEVAPGPIIDDVDRPLNELRRSASRLHAYCRSVLRPRPTGRSPSWGYMPSES